eukprot:gene3857-4214_t
MPYHVPLQGLAGGKRTLVILDDLEKLSKYSIFLGDLASRGHQLTYHQAEATNLELTEYGEYLFDNVLLFAPKVENFGSIDVNGLVEFVRSGKNLLVATAKETSESVRELTEAFGVEVDAKGTEIIDHFERYDELDLAHQHTTVLAKEAIESPAVLGEFAGQAGHHPILFRGVGHSVAPDNILAVRVLRGNPTSYSYFPNKVIGDSPLRMGQDALLVSAIQGRNNARVLVAGSLDMFSNEFFVTQVNGKASGNRAFCAEVSKWSLGESGVLRFRNIVHHKSDGSPPDVILHEKARPDLPVTLYPDPEITRNSLVYRIKDEIVYSMIVEEFRDGVWKPFHSSDMQMEFVMLDAYIRKTMIADPKSGLFLTTFTAPDSYGVFKFRVLYRRTGYSVIHAETQVSIRPFKHNEYERFIVSAYPYYSSSFSALVAFVIFSVLFLYSSD